MYYVISFFLLSLNINHLFPKEVLQNFSNVNVIFKDSILINANIDKFGDKDVYIIPLYVNGEAQRNSSKNGRFSFKLPKRKDGIRYVLRTSDNKLKIEFYVDNDDVNIEGTLGGPYRIRSGRTQRDFESFSKKQKLLENHNFGLYKEGRLEKDRGDSIRREKTGEKREDVFAERKELTKSYVKENPQSFVSLDLVYVAFNSSDYTISEIRELWNRLSDSVKISELGDKLQQQIVSLVSPSFNYYKAPNFVSKNPNNKVVSLQDFRGHYVLVDFWASWCVPCREENPNVLKIYEAFHSRGFEVLGVSLDHDKDKWTNAIKQDKLPWEQVSNLKGWKDDLVKSFGINGIPDNFLVDPNGVVVARGLRGELLDAKIREIFTD